MKTSHKAFTFIELLVSILLISIISVYAILFYKQSYLSFENEFEIEKLKLQFINTKLFLEKNKALENLNFKDSTLFYNDYLLLKDVTTYNISLNTDIDSLSFCIKNRVCKEIKIIK